MLIKVELIGFGAGTPGQICLLLFEMPSWNRFASFNPRRTSKLFVPGLIVGFRWLIVASQYRRESRAETMNRETLVPCSPGDIGAKEVDVMQVDPDLILAPDVSKVCSHCL